MKKLGLYLLSWRRSAIKEVNDWAPSVTNTKKLCNFLCEIIFTKNTKKLHLILEEHFLPDPTNEKSEIHGIITLLSYNLQVIESKLTFKPVISTSAYFAFPLSVIFSILLWWFIFILWFMIIAIYRINGTWNFHGKRNKKIREIDFTEKQLQNSWNWFHRKKLK